MSKEAQQPSLEQLEARKEKLGRVIGQREKLVENLLDKTGIPDLINLDQDLIIADQIIPKVQASRERAVRSLDLVTRQIDSISQNAQLLENARNYLSEVELRQAQLDKIKEAADAGRLRQEVWLLRRQELAELRARGNQNPDLRRGIDLLKQEEKEKEKKPKKRKTKRGTAPETKEKQLSKMVLDTQSQEVTIDGKTIKVKSEIRWKVLVYLAQKPNKDISYKKVAKIAKDAGYKGQNPAGNTINLVRRSIERDFRNPQILTHSGSRGTSKYRLNAQVEFVGEKVEKAQPEKQKAKKGFPELIESRKHALEYFLLGLATTEDVITILGPSKVTEKALTRPQAMFALGGCINLLYAKIKTDQAGEEEKTLWKLVKTYTHTSEKTDRETWEETFDTIKEWFTKKEPLSEQEVSQMEVIEEEVKPLTDGEAAILAFAIDAEKEYLKAAGLKTLPEEIKEELWNQVKGKVKIDREQIVEMRRSVLNKVKRLIENEIYYQFTYEHSNAVLDLISYLTSSDSDEILKLLETWLSGGNIIELVDDINYERNKKENGRAEKHVKEPKPYKPEEKSRREDLQPTEQTRPQAVEQEEVEANLTINDLALLTDIPEKILIDRVLRFLKSNSSIRAIRKPGQGRRLFFTEEDFNKLLESSITNPVQKTAKTTDEAVKPEEESSILPKVEEPSKKEVAYSIELHDPEIRKKINEYLDRIEETGLETFSGASLNKFFQRLKKHIQDMYLEKGWVKPGLFKNGHPEFSKSDAVAMLYFYDFKNGMSKNLARQTYKIIKGEDDKRNKEKQEGKK